MLQMRDDIALWEAEGAESNHFRQELSIDPGLFLPGAKTGLWSRYSPRFPKADIVHSSYYRAEKGRKNSVITVHDFIQELYPSSWRDGLFARLKKQAIARADTIITVSKHTLDDMHSLYPWSKDKHAVIIHNGVDEEYFPLADPQGVQLETTILPRDSYFLYVGNRGYCKNFAACRYFMDHPLARDENLKFVIVGGGPFSEKEKELFAPFLDQIVFLPFAPNEQLNLLYNNARALLFPSYYEGFGIPALEAAKAGCIVMASNQSSVPEVVGKTSFMFDPRSKSEIDAATNKLADIDVIAREKEHLIAHASKFGWQKNAEQTNALYDRLLGL
jgi:mannosyltransferase